VVRKVLVFPPEEKISATLAQRPFNFAHSKRERERVIRDLLGVFKSIELVSIILRFVRPDAYGQARDDRRKGGGASLRVQNLPNFS
jgi:hypothetical protein